MRFSFLFFVIIILLSGCKVSIDTTSNTPVAFNDDSPSSQNAEIQQMKEEIASLKRERDNKIEQLEREISNLKQSDSGAEAGTEETMEIIKKVVLNYSYAAEFDDFEYRETTENLENIGSVLSFKSEDGDIWGDFIIDKSEYFMAEYLENLTEACSDVFTSSPISVKNNNMPVEEHNVLCLSDDGIQMLNTSTIFYGDGGQYVLQETSFYKNSKSKVLTWFYEAAENVRRLDRM